ncbi:hypothetical protein C8T65DRAFT_750555 [Cerioporus squamosus]|nr:hypothetical protein C8T65DRAFT_750555 [Cerioporus squamosus]
MAAQSRSTSAPQPNARGSQLLRALLRLLEEEPRDHPDRNARMYLCVQYLAFALRGKETMAFGSDASPPEEEELVQSLRQLMSPEVPSASAPTPTTSRSRGVIALSDEDESEIEYADARRDDRVRRGLPYYNTWDGAAGASSHTGRRAIATNPVAATPPPAINPVPVTPSAPAAPLSAAPAPPAATPTPAATPVPSLFPPLGRPPRPSLGPPHPTSARSTLLGTRCSRGLPPRVAPTPGTSLPSDAASGSSTTGHHQMRRATDTVKGNSACSASSCNAAIESFVTQLSIPDVVKCYPNA